MSRPTRQTPGGRAYLDLQNRARRERRTTQELTGKHSLSHATMHAALAATAAHRGVALRPLPEVVGGFSAARQPAYDAFRRRLGPDGAHLPTNLTEVVTDVIRFADPLITSKESTVLWSPIDRAWAVTAQARSEFINKPVENHDDVRADRRADRRRALPFTSDFAGLLVTVR